MHRCEALTRDPSSFTMMGQDERGHGIGGRGHVFQVVIRQGAPLFPLSSAVLADTALGKVLLTGVSFAATGSSWQLRVHRVRNGLAVAAYLREALDELRVVSRECMRGDAALRAR